MASYGSIFTKKTPSSYEYNKKKNKKLDEKFQSSIVQFKNLERKSNWINWSRHISLHSYCLRVIRLRLSRLPPPPSNRPLLFRRIEREHPYFDKKYLHHFPSSPILDNSFDDFLFADSPLTTRSTRWTRLSTGITGVITGYRSYRVWWLKMVFDALRFTLLTQFHNEEKSWLQRGAAEKFTRGMSHSSLSSGAPTSRRDIKAERLEEHDSVNVCRAANSTNRYFLPGLSPEKPFVLIFRTLSLSLLFLLPPCENSPIPLKFHQRMKSNGGSNVVIARYESFFEERGESVNNLGEEETLERILVKLLKWYLTLISN